MAKRITQETFDEVVRENQEEFDMSPDEARSDAIAQFESQGVDLSNVITTAITTAADGSGSVSITEKIKEALNILTDLSRDFSAFTDDDKQDLQETLQILRKEFEGPFACRSFAAVNGGYGVFLGLVRLHQDNSTILLQVLPTFISFSDGQPDLFDEEGMNLVCSMLSQNKLSAETLCAVVKLLRMSCIKHENNRQSYVKEGAIRGLINLLEVHKGDAPLVKESCAALRGFVVDDDIRVPFGKAHDHAKAIVEEGAMEALFGILDVSDDSDQVIVGEVMATLGRLAVRNEFCQKIVDLGGLKYVTTAMSQHMSNQVMMKQIISMTKAIAGNDEVKIAIVSVGGVPLILQAVQTHVKVAQVCEAGCSALAMISLRNPKNAAVIMENSAAEVIAQVMAVHPGIVGVQNSACMAIRNLVARTREHCKSFLDVGAESLIRDAMALPECNDLAKAALRDLDCQVELKELWKGEKNPLTVP